MRLLIGFAAWAGDSSPNTQKWLQWYSEILKHEFSGDDIYLAISNKSDDVIHEALSDVRFLKVAKVSEELHINSDASQFQLFLRDMAPHLRDYDYVSFLHTKGISYDFDAFESWRENVKHTIFSRACVEAQFLTGRNYLVAERGHMIQARSSIRRCAELGKKMGIAAPAFHYAATTTLFHAPAHVVSDLVEKLPDAYLSRNIAESGESRFFFEGTIPSLLTMLGAEPTFLGGEKFEEGLNMEICYDMYPLHNSAVVKREYGRMVGEGGAFEQAPIPYVFGNVDALKALNISFEL